MKTKAFVIPFSLLTLLSCGGSGNNEAGTPADTTGVETVAGDLKLLPELIFDDLEIASTPNGSGFENTKKVVIKGDELKIWLGQKEISCKLDLSASREEAEPTGYYWYFTTVENASLPATEFAVSTEYEEACLARNMDPKERSIQLSISNLITFYPKKFNSWGNLKRKITQTYPSDEKYQQVLAYVNREEPSPEDIDEGATSSGLSVDDLKKIVKIIDEEYDADKFVFKGRGGSCLYVDRNGDRVETEFYCYPFSTGGWMVYAPNEYVSDKGHRFASLSFKGYKDGIEIPVDPALELVDDANGKECVDEVYAFSDKGVVIKKKSGGKIILSEYVWNGQMMTKE